MIEGSLLRVLITRLSAVGDCVHTLPLASAIRARYPRAMIAWACESTAAPLVKAHPAVNRMVVLPKGWLSSPTALFAARRQLRALRCDTVIDAQSLSKSAVAGWLSGARTRIGFAPPQGREVAPWLHTTQIERRAAHVVDAYLELLEPLNITAPRVRFRVAPEAAARETIDKFLFYSGLQGGYAVLNVGAGWESKVWPAERYALVARHIAHAAGLKCVVVGASEQERRWGQQVVAAAEGQAVLAPAMSLPELTALLHKARFFIGSDTGPLHLAAALDVPCIALFGPTDPANSGPYGAGHVTLHKQALPPGESYRRVSDNAAMRAIETADVCAAIDALLARPASEQPVAPVAAVATIGNASADEDARRAA